MPGVGDDQVEPAGLLDEALDGGAHLLAVADVGGQRDRARAELARQRTARPRTARSRPDGRRRGPRAPPPRARPIPREAPVTSARVVASMRMRAEDMLQAMSQDQVTVAEEEYLQTIFWLHEAGLPMTGANVARAMQLSAPTVHEMIGRLERDGYVTRGPDKVLAFTDSGLEHAEGIVRRHRLIERFLTDVLGIPWDDVHEEAERLEHAMSPKLEERMLAAIGDAKTCPHGHPITPGRPRSRASRSPTSRRAPR